MADPKVKIAGVEKTVHMGLGEAVLRLMHVELNYTNNLDVSEELVSERNLIVEALNQQYKLDLGFDCDDDGVPDSVAIFEESAKTSCCRILPTSSGRTRTSSSRRTKARNKR